MIKLRIETEGKVLEKTFQQDAKPGEKVTHVYPSKAGHIVTNDIKDGIDMADAKGFTVAELKAAGWTEMPVITPPIPPAANKVDFGKKV